MDRKWWTLLAVCVGTFMLLLDVTIVNTALPYIERSLGASFTDLQWVIDAYALSLAALLLTGGSLADLLGRRRIFVAGLVVFTAASLACGLAESPLMLNLSRAVQGAGAAFMFATSLALLASAFHGPDRGTAFGLWGATTGAAVAIGPLVGGALTQAFGWEFIFFVNVPIGIGAIALTLAKVDESHAPAGGRIDWAGLVTFSGGLFCLIFALIRGNAEGWSSALIVGLLVAALILLVAFVLVEARSAQPMLDLSLFKSPTFNGASLAAFSLSASMFAMFLYLTLYIQNSLGYSALEAGLRFLPTTLLAFFIAPISGKLADRYGVRWFIAGGLVLVGLGLLLMRDIGPGDDWTAMLAGFMVAGGGIGAVNPALATAAISVVEPQRAGMASGINSTFRQVGIATGTAALGAVFTHIVNGQAPVFARGRAPRRHRGRRRPRRPVLRLHLLRRLPQDRRRRAGARRRARGLPRGPARDPPLRRDPRARVRRAVRVADPPERVRAAAAGGGAGAGGRGRLGDQSRGRGRPAPPRRRRGARPGRAARRAGPGRGLADLGLQRGAHAERRRPHAAPVGGEREQLAPPVARVGAALDEPGGDHVVDHLLRGLLGHVEALGEPRERERIRVERADHVAPRRAHRQPRAVHGRHQPVDQDAVGGDEQDREIGFVRRA